MKKIAALGLLVLTSCYGEWDVPKVPRRDPCSGKVENQYVYFMPKCPLPENPNSLIPSGDSEPDPGGYRHVPHQLRKKLPQRLIDRKD